MPENSVLSEAKNLLIDAVNFAAECTNLAKPERKQEAIKYVCDKAESVDHLIPVIGQWMDLPFVDLLEQKVIGLGIEWAYTTIFGVKHG